MAECIPEVQQFMLDKHTLALGKHTKIIAAIRSELAGLEDVQWDQSGFGGHSGDLARLKKQVNSLLELGKFDDLVYLGPEILEAGSRAIEHEHEGESSYTLSDCLAVIFKALPDSSLESVDQLIWAIDMELEDNYSLCDGLVSPVLEKQHSREAWSLLADKLNERLANHQILKDTSDYSKLYHRNRLGGWAAYALEKAKRTDEIISLYIKEAQITDSYQRLVAYLIKLEKWDDAKKHCLQGIKELQPKTTSPARLYDQLENIYQSTNNDSQMAALIADEFFSRPNLNSFNKLLETGKKLKQSEVIDAWARYFLETGIEPKRKGNRSGKLSNTPQAAWPLPTPEAPPRQRLGRRDEPHLDVLIEIAIAEKKPQEVIRWYDKKQSANGRFHNFITQDDNVAEAVKSEYPERALRIWQAIVQGKINQVSSKGYEAAEPLLKKIKKLMHDNKMHAEWKTYIAALCQENRRRPNCIKVLNRVENAGKPLLKTIRP
jgi:uncharacterized Zn finger protein